MWDEAEHVVGMKGCFVGELQFGQKLLDLGFGLHPNYTRVSSHFDTAPNGERRTELVFCFTILESNHKGNRRDLSDQHV